MANKEYSRRIAERRGKIELGILPPNAPSVVDEPHTPEEKNRFKRLWTPKVQEKRAQAQQQIGESVETNDHMLAYQASVDKWAVSAYGERAINAIDWSQPPVIGKAEIRYLVVLNNVAKSLYTGQYHETKQIMQGITATFGSNGDSGGFPCSPEILMTVMNVEGFLQSIFQTAALQENDSKWGKGLGEIIHEVVRGYTHQNRAVVYTSMTALHDSIKLYFNEKRLKLAKSQSTHS